MPHDSVGCCHNGKRYPERMIVHSNVKDKEIVFHKLPVNEERQKTWIQAVSKGREDFEEANYCSNHFLEEKPTKYNPDQTLFSKIL